MSEQGPEKKSSGCRLGCLALLAVGLGITVLLVAAVVYALNVAGVAPDIGRIGAFHRTERGVDESPALTEIWSSGLDAAAPNAAKVVRIPLAGVIFLGEPGSVGDPGSADSALRAIRHATHDPDVEGIILEVDSGGGGITASDVIYQALLDFKRAQEDRVVVALMGDMAASGAYYVSLAADKVMAHPTTLTGSIGVIMQSYNIRELARKLGVEDVTIKSGANKDLLNPFREMSDEQRAMLQKLVDSLHTRFVKLVAESRQLDEADVRKLADGRVFLADEALGLKLIDALGYMADAEQTMAGLLEVDDLHVVRYEEELSIFDILRFRRGGFGMHLRRFLNEDETRFLYQWSP